MLQKKSLPNDRRAIRVFISAWSPLYFITIPKFLANGSHFFWKFFVSSNIILLPKNKQVVALSPKSRTWGQGGLKLDGVAPLVANPWLILIHCVGRPCKLCYASRKILCIQEISVGLGKSCCASRQFMCIHTSRTFLYHLITTILENQPLAKPCTDLHPLNPEYWTPYHGGWDKF